MREIFLRSNDPDLKYNQVIRPWKSRLGLLYIEKQSLYIDFYIIVTTIVAILNKPAAINLITRILKKLQANKNLIGKRDKDLFPYPPPGTDKIVNDRLS